MKRLLYLGIVLGLVLAAYWLGSAKAHRDSAIQASVGNRKVLYYVDPMNPAHTSDKPGKAPCGMDMEPVYADSLPAGATAGGDTPALPQGTIKISPEKQQLIGVRAEVTQSRKLIHNVRLLGKVA